MGGRLVDRANMELEEARSQDPGGFEGYGEDMKELKEVEDIGVPGVAKHLVNFGSL